MSSLPPGQDLPLLHGGPRRLTADETSTSLQYGPITREVLYPRSGSVDRRTLPQKLPQ